MTDKDIIHSLECCCDRVRCDECYFAFKGGCDNKLKASVLELINRQQAEIKRLESIISTDNQMIKSLNKCYEISKAEAIKEFADRLGDYKEYRYNENCDFVPYVRLSDIEKVANEMVVTDNDK